MDDKEIRVSWRAAIVPLSGNTIVHGRLSMLGKRKAVVKADRNLPPGHRCELALMLPKNSPDDVVQFIEGRGVVTRSVLSAEQFHITLDWVELRGNSESLLKEYIGKYRALWKQ
ncbi:MAG: hypothetical protein WC742_06980 [Gallionellaceae bacterium]